MSTLTVMTIKPLKTITVNFFSNSALISISKYYVLRITPQQATD